MPVEDLRPKVFDFCSARKGALAIPSSECLIFAWGDEIGLKANLVLKTTVLYNYLLRSYITLYQRLILLLPTSRKAKAKLSKQPRGKDFSERELISKSFNVSLLLLKSAQHYDSLNTSITLEQFRRKTNTVATIPILNPLPERH